MGCDVSSSGRAVEPRRLWAAAILGTLATVCGCRSEPSPRQVGVQELARLLEGDHAPKVYDVNGDSTRREYGVIPHATLLPGSADYPLDVLPADKHGDLVFYCASYWCGAAETAARRAMKAGYTEVSVLSEGIKGWAQAGLPVARVN